MYISTGIYIRESKKEITFTNFGGLIFIGMIKKKYCKYKIKTNAVLLL